MATRCDRPSCSETAAVAYSLDYRQRLVWLGDIDPELEAPMALCERCATALTSPKGWDLVDVRGPVLPMWLGDKPEALPAVKDLRRREAVTATTPGTSVRQPMLFESFDDPDVAAQTIVASVIDTSSELLRKAFQTALAS